MLVQRNITRVPRYGPQVSGTIVSGYDEWRMMQKQTALGGVQLLIVLFCIWCGEGAGEVKVKTVGPVARAACGAKQVEQCSFVDRFRTFDTKRWEKSANYENGSPFASWWAASAAFVNPATQTLNLAITLAFNPDVFSRYASGEVKSTGRYRYGCYEARIRPNTQPGYVAVHPAPYLLPCLLFFQKKSKLSIAPSSVLPMKII